MEKTNYTPGPWYGASMGNDYQGLVVDEKTGANIAVVYDKTNARLIAAAPDLLEACRWLVDYAPTPTDAARVRAAIAKAEGRE